MREVSQIVSKPLLRGRIDRAGAAPVKNRSQRMLTIEKSSEKKSEVLVLVTGFRFIGVGMRMNRAAGGGNDEW